MHYLNITSANFIVLIVLVISTSECSMKKDTQLNYSDSVRKDSVRKDSFRSYFQILSDKQDMSYFYMINKVLKLDESINLKADLEVRILSSKDFSDHIYYRLIYKNDKWKGEIYTIENLTLTIKDVKPFSPINGWEKVEESLVANDILNIPDFVYEGNYLHPRIFDIQVITKKNMKIISLQDFYNKENKLDSFYIKIENFMRAIFGNEYKSKILLN